MKLKTIFKAAVIVLIALGLIILINFIPTFSLKTQDMNIAEGGWVNVYYEKEKDAALDVFGLADSRSKELSELLGFGEKQNINIYVYDKQSTMQSKKYGLIGPLLGLDWYIGDNIGTNVILTSPANPGKVHNYDTVKNAVLHEIVHAYVSVMNPDISLWLTEGTALYLSNGEPFSKDVLNYMKIPSYKEICTKNPIEFSNIGGYSLAHTYIEYLSNEYGWNKVLELLKTENYTGIFGKPASEIYSEWTAYISDYK